MTATPAYDLFSIELLKNRFLEPKGLRQRLQLKSLLRARGQIRKFTSLQCITKENTCTLRPQLRKHENRIARELQKRLFSDYVRGRLFDFGVYIIGLFSPLAIAVFMKIDNPITVSLGYLAPFFIFLILILLAAFLMLLIVSSISSLLPQRFSSLFFLTSYIAIPILLVSSISRLFVGVPFEYLYFLVAPVIAAACMFTVSILYFLWEWIYDFAWRRRLRTTCPDSIIIDSMLDILYQVENHPEQWSKLEHKALLIQKLSVISKVFQKNVVQHLQTFDPPLDLWLKEILSHYCAKLFYYQKIILLSKAESRTKLLEDLSKDFLNILEGNWGALPKLVPIKFKSNQRVSLFLETVRVIITALLPLTILLIIQQTSISLDEPLAEYLKTGTIIWGILTIITALDPTINEKINTLKEITNLIPFQNNKE